MTDTPHRVEPPDGIGRVTFTITATDRAGLRRGIADALRLYDPTVEGWTISVHVEGDTPDHTWSREGQISRPREWHAEVAAAPAGRPSGTLAPPLVQDDDLRYWPLSASLPDGREAAYVETGCRFCPDGHEPADRWLVLADSWAEVKDGQPTRIIVYPHHGGHIAPTDVDAVRAALGDRRPTDGDPVEEMVRVVDPMGRAVDSVERPNPSRVTSDYVRGPNDVPPRRRRWRRRG